MPFLEWYLILLDVNWLGFITFWSITAVILVWCYEKKSSKK